MPAHCPAEAAREARLPSAGFAPAVFIRPPPEGIAPKTESGADTRELSGSYPTARREETESKVMAPARWKHAGLQPGSNRPEGRLLPRQEAGMRWLAGGGIVATAAVAVWALLRRLDRDGFRQTDESAPPDPTPGHRDRYRERVGSCGRTGLRRALKSSEDVKMAQRGEETYLILRLVEQGAAVS
jgi:hypothetical protein